MPVLFIGHGSPMNIILENPFTNSLTQISKNIPIPKAILVISAHWLTQGTKILCVNNPKTIYDFYGFPKKLYQITYPSSGSPKLAKDITKRIKSYEIKCDFEWGLDHASWAILKHIYPKADIPVLELSLDYQFNSWSPKPIEYHYKLAKELSFLRNENVLIIGSGNIVHNLGIMDYNIDAHTMAWAQELDKKVKQNLMSKNHNGLIDYPSMGEIAKIGIPTWDHYLPFIYVIALQEEGESIKLIHEGFQHGSISMRCFQIG